MTEKLKEFEKWLRENTSLKSISRKQYIMQIKKFLSSIEDNEIDESNVLRFLRDGHRVYARRFAVKKFCEFMNRSDISNAVDRIKKDLRLRDRRYERYIDFNTFKLLLDSLSNELRTGLMVLYDTAMRVSTIVNLKVKDIKHDNEGDYIIATEKGGRLTSRYLDNHTSVLLKNLIELEGKTSNDYVFRQLTDGNRYETWWECYYRMWKELKIKSKKFLGQGFGISFHWVRTSRARELYSRYKDLLKVQNMLGHKSPQTTMRYLEAGRFTSSEIIREEEGKYD